MEINLDASHVIVSASPDSPTIVLRDVSDNEAVFIDGSDIVVLMEFLSRFL